MDEERSDSAAHVHYIETVDEEELQADSARHLSRGGMPPDQQFELFEIVCPDWTINVDTIAHVCSTILCWLCPPAMVVVLQYLALLATTPQRWRCTCPEMYGCFLSQSCLLRRILCRMVSRHSWSSCITPCRRPSLAKTVVNMQMLRAAHWASLRPQPLCCLGRSPLQ